VKVSRGLSAVSFCASEPVTGIRGR
jgi:hypothetical protein